MHCCSIDKTNHFIACGGTSGAIIVMYLSDELLPNSKFYKLTEVAYRKDAAQECSDIKFSPSNDMIALGTHDNFIYIYGCDLSVQETGYGQNVTSVGLCTLKALQRLRGHTSYITHLGMIPSTCDQRSCAVQMSAVSYILIESTSIHNASFHLINMYPLCYCRFCVHASNCFCRLEL